MELGLLINDGVDEIDGRFDVGGFVTIKENAGGIGLAKVTAGVSQTLGCRENFDGTDVELSIGLGDVGGSVAGVGDRHTGNESVSLNIGPQIGFESQITQTFSFTAGDLGRLVGRIIHGPIP